MGTLVTLIRNGSLAASFAGVRPLIYTDRLAAVGAAGLVGWLMSVELGTSRSASKTAGDGTGSGETVVDTTTGRVFDVAAAVALLGGIGASAALPASTIPARRATYLLGALLLGGSGVLSRAARRHLGRFHRDSLTIHPDHELVNTGPYQRVRHPLYTATVGSLVGIGAVLGSWLSVGFTALPIAAIVRRIAVEEEMLISALGNDYADYRQRTNKLVPGIW